MVYTKKNILIICVVILCIVLLIKIIYIKNSNKDNKDDINELFINSNIETFEDAIDLLNKIKSNDIIEINTTTTLPIDEANIIHWSTKLQNLKDNPAFIAVGLYKPKLTINGKKYKKLGDMINTSPLFLPPSSNDAVLLINTDNSDIREPTDYILVKKIGTVTTITNIIELQSILNKSNIGVGSQNIYTILTNFINYKANIQSYITKNADFITESINTIIKSNTCITYYTTTTNIKKIALNDILIANQNTNNEITISIVNNTTIRLPVGVDISIGTTDNKKYNINWYNNIDITKILLNSNTNVNYNAYTTNNFVKVPDANKTAKYITYTFYPYNYIKNDIIEYLQTLCNNMLIIYDSNDNNNNDAFIEYLQLAKDRNTIINVLTELQNILEDITIKPVEITQAATGTGPIIKVPNVFDSLPKIISTDTTSSTLLSNIISLIVNNSENYYYPFIEFNSTQLIFIESSVVFVPVTTSISTPTPTILYNDGLVNKFTINNSINNINTILNTIPKPTLNTVSTKAITENIKLLTKLLTLNTAINTGLLDVFPLYIYKPIAPPDYVALGHVFCNYERELNLIKSAKSVACVPIHCTRVIREWLITDKVFEYSKNNIYCAIYKNPYTGTFIAVDKVGLPEGKVYKVVACVAKCTAIDDLTKSDDCARKYQQLNKSIVDNITTQMPDIGSTEETIYLKKIKEQSNSIARLKTRAQNMQLILDKSEIVNEEMNKAKLQNYVDTQQRNIELVANKLETDKNTIKTNINIPIDILNKIINMINNMSSLTQPQKSAIIDKIIYNATKLSNNIITEAEFKETLSKILRACPNYDTGDLVLKSLVEEVCYGCDNPK